LDDRYGREVSDPRRLALRECRSSYAAAHVVPIRIRLKS
jgi:hypothetical protein